MTFPPKKTTLRLMQQNKQTKKKTTTIGHQNGTVHARRPFHSIAIQQLNLLRAPPRPVLGGAAWRAASVVRRCGRCDSECTTGGSKPPCISPTLHGIPGQPHGSQVNPIDPRSTPLIPGQPTQLIWRMWQVPDRWC